MREGTRAAAGSLASLAGFTSFPGALVGCPTMGHQSFAAGRIDHNSYFSRVAKRVRLRTHPACNLTWIGRDKRGLVL